MFQKYNHLGFNNPYYFKKEGKFVIKSNLATLLDEYGSSRKIDPVAIIEILNKTYILGDRTIIEGIQKTPWLSKPNKDNNNWEYDKIPKHGQLNLSEQEIAHTLFQKICSELQLYIGNKTQVGILLSGGMDSRMVAGALDYLLKKNKLPQAIEVTALTWGNIDSRDVIYAKEIANRLNWKWKHYTVTAKDLLNNISEAAIHGCEYSPIHLHAIPQIRDDNANLKVILAGSYGDSVGRAEYGGWKLKFLKPFLSKMINFASIINQDVFDNTLCYVESDVKSYHTKFPEKELYVQNELDYQLHYMRRWLNPCMELLNEKSEFYQVFTHPDVYSYMWSLLPERRNDLVYKYMYNDFVTKLDDIPWARTGLPYGEKEGKPDNLKKDHHSYVKILKTEIFDDITSAINSGSLKKLGIFNLRAIKKLIFLLKLFPSNNLFFYEKLIFLASISKMVNIYKIEGMKNANIKSSNRNFELLEHLYYRVRQSAAPILKKYIQKIKKS
jgi:hypothetical protein